MSVLHTLRTHNTEYVLFLFLRFRLHSAMAQTLIASAWLFHNVDFRNRTTVPVRDVRA